MSVLVWTGDHNKSIAERLRLTNTLAVDVLIDSNIYANAMTPNKHKRAGPLRRRRSLASHSASFHRLRTRAWPGSVDRTPSTCNHPQKRNTRRWLQVLHSLSITALLSLHCGSPTPHVVPCTALHLHSRAPRALPAHRGPLIRAPRRSYPRVVPAACVCARHLLQSIALAHGRCPAPHSASGPGALHPAICTPRLSSIRALRRLSRMWCLCACALHKCSSHLRTRRCLALPTAALQFRA